MGRKKETSMEPILAFIGIVAAFIGIGAGVVQIIDYVERKKQQRATQIRNRPNSTSADNATKTQQRDNRVHPENTFNQNASDFSSSRTTAWMQSAGIESLAVDDCVMLLGSEHFKGWTSSEIIVTIDNAPMQIPDELDKVIQEHKEQAMGTKHDGLGLRVISLTPGFKDAPSVLVSLSPVRFSSHFTITTLLDKPVLESTEGAMVTIRNKYGSTALHYNSFEFPPIPTSVSLQIAVISSDNQLLLMKRSNHVAFYPNAWTVSIEEGMLANDTDFFQGILRGISEELGNNIRVEREDIRILSFCVEYPTLSFDVICLVKAQNLIEDIRQSWRLTAPDKHELSQSQIVAVELKELVQVFLDKRQWHPSARMRILQILFGTFGVDATLSAINDVQATYENKNLQ